MTPVQNSLSSIRPVNESVGVSVLGKALDQQGDLAMKLIRMTTEQMLQMQKDQGLGTIIDTFA